MNNTFDFQPYLWPATGFLTWLWFWALHWHGEAIENSRSKK